MSPSDNTSNPLSEVAHSVGAMWAALGSVVSALVAGGILTAVQANTVAAIGEAAPGVITLLGAIIAAVSAAVVGVIAATRTVAIGRDHVTPSARPRGYDAAGNLVPLAPVTSMSPPNGEKYMN